MLEIKSLTKVYPNGKVGCKDVTLTIQPGDLYAFIGPNGSGKTTTIKCAVGIQTITSGDSLIEGVSIQKDPIGCKRKVAYVPDQPDVYTALTGIQYLNFVSDIYQIEKTKRVELIKKYADVLEMGKDLNTPIGAYSHGMRQKIVLISALIREPKVLILDEPFVGLDPIASDKLKKLMIDFCKAGGCIFFSTHVLEVAEKLCNKVAIIKSGEIIMNGKMEDVKKNKSLEQVFLGEVAK